MDKYEFNIKVEQIKKLVNRGDYETAMKIADTIDWHRVRNASLLSMIAQIYEKNKEYQEAKDILLLAFERAPIGKRLLYSDLFQTEFGETREGIWLRENCAEFGFIIRYPENKTEITGVRYEPWHLRYVGTEVASYIMENNLTLYLLY